jgi:hypothetical protein
MPAALMTSTTTGKSQGNAWRPQIEISITDDSYAPTSIDFQVRNTFIHLSDDINCYERFCIERAVQSCPGVQVGCLSSAFIDVDAPKKVVSSVRPVIRLEDALIDMWPATPDTFQTSALAGPVLMPRYAFGLDQPHKQYILPFQPSLLNLPVTTHVELHAGTKITPRSLESDMPSAGSALHSSGECKPCAFLYTRGCENGPSCNFCHLCEPGEKKRRQKEKRAAFKGGA